MEPRELPPVGSKIILDYGPKNPNTWKLPAVVIAVIDGEAMVVRRYFKRDGRWLSELQLIDIWRWTASAEHFRICPEKEKRATRKPPAK